jgi:PBP1b-binding outer membrane lipoprotein LpoB
MKKLVFPFLVIAVIFSACKKEEETPANNTETTYAFSCKINGADFTDNNPLSIVDPSTNVFTIDAENGTNSIRFIIYNFSNRTTEEQISLNNITDKAYVTLGTDEYTNTVSGKLIFSEIGNSISGTFNAQCNNLQTFQSVTVTEGKFADIAY